jgi:hypothetical protein
MKLLFSRKMRKTILRTFLYVLTVGLLCNIAYAQLKPDLPILGFGVREGGGMYPNLGDINNPTSDWWPDSRIWTVPSKYMTDGSIKYREILVPVFISNRWYNFDKVPGVKFQEISSFAFRVYYDDRSLQFVDVQKHHPYTEEEAKNLRTTHYYSSQMGYYTPLAYNFNVTASNNKADDFYRYFDKYDTVTDASGNTTYRYAGIGSIVSIAGTSSSFHNLDTTPYGETRVLLYLKFRVIPTTIVSSNDIRTCKIYFDPTYICYNGINVAKGKGIDLLEDYPTSPADPNYIRFADAFTNVLSYYTETNDNMQYFDRSWSSGDKLYNAEQRCKGLQLYGNYSDIDKYAIDPYLPGSITLKIMNSYNTFNFDVMDQNSILNPNARIVKDADDLSLWRLAEPITADNLVSKRTAYNNRSERAIMVTASLTYPSTMEEIIVETDQNWLRVRSTDDRNLGYENKFGNLIVPNMQNPVAVRRAYCQRINNLIGPTNDYNPFPSLPANDNNKPGSWQLVLDCNQEGLAPGEYVGYVTLKSPFDRYEATRIEVRFIVLDSPKERVSTPAANTEVPYGIMLKITPFNGTRTDLTRTLIMGSAELATDLTDSLFGEYTRSHPLGFTRFGAPMQFDARFFLDTTVFSPSEKPTDPVGIADWNNLAMYGFGDYSHHDGITSASANDSKMPRSDSRDIRSSIPGIHSNVHYVKYKYDGSDDFYPVVLEWDASQFIQANTIHLKYMQNGQLYVRDMRSEGTPIGGDKYTFTFSDKSVQEFWIEYTVGESSRGDLVDNFGDDMIVPYAWNFVSLPLNPVNKFHSYIFPNSLNIPYLFSQNQWQQPSDGYLQPGIGYFVKYHSLVDKEFKGAYFNLISRANFPVKLYTGTDGKGGWNAIGALSNIVNIDKISFESFDDGGPAADYGYTINHGIWAYRSNQGYVEVNALYPGKAYFIKVDRNSYLNIDGKGKAIFTLPTKLDSRVVGFDKISVADANQKVANLYAANNVDINNYQLPPVPPTEMFDVRFSKNNYVSNYDASLVNMQGISYPVSINFENPRANYSVIDPVSGEIYGTIKAGETNNVIINFSKSNSFKLVAEASNETFFVSVDQNPVTTNSIEVSFGIDNDASVSLSIFNSIGSEVANINAGLLNRGVHKRTFDVTNFSTGVYMVRLLANGETKIFMMHIIK